MTIKLREKYDVVIIGSGAGGGTVAEILSHYVDKGLSVLLLEAGPYWKKENFNQQERDMSRIYFSRGAIFSKHMNIAVAAARVVGGSTAVYTGVSFRPPPEVCEKWQTQFGLDFLTSDFTNNTLDKIESMINVHEPPLSWDNDNNRLFREGCEKLEIPVKRLRINVKGCKQQGFCNLGCTAGAKQGTLEVQIPMAISRGVEIIYNSWVDHITAANEIRFTVKPAWHFTEPNAIAEGEYNIKADKIVVAAGSLHTPALLLRSRRYLKFNNSNLGRYLTLHPAYNVNGIYPTAIHNYRGFPKTYYVDAFSESEGYYLETSFYFPGITAKNIPQFGELHEATMKKYHHMLSILILTHDPASYHNRIAIDRKGNTVLDYKVDAQVKISLVKALRRSAAIFLAAGCEQTILPGMSKATITAQNRDNLDRVIDSKYLNFARTPLSSAHPQGGCRMGSDPQQSVVSTNGRLHGQQNIFVADASLFPTSVKVNPYQTVMLLASHVADNVVQSLDV